MFSFAIPSDDDAKTLLDWRTKPRVSHLMATDVAYDLGKQRQWLAACRDKADYRHWIIMAGDRKIGLIYLADIDWRSRTSAWGFYIGEDDFLGLGGLVPPYLYNHVFFDMGFERIDAEVLASNEEVVDLHRLHGYRYLELKRRAVEKNGEQLDLHRLALSAEDWRLQAKFHRFRAAFPIEPGAAAAAEISGAAGAKG